MIAQMRSKAWQERHSSLVGLLGYLLFPAFLLLEIGPSKNGKEGNYTGLGFICESPRTSATFFAITFDGDIKFPGMIGPNGTSTGGLTI